MQWIGKIFSRDIWLVAAILVFLPAALIGSIQAYSTMTSLLWNYRTGTWLIVEAQSEHQNTLLALKNFQLSPDDARLAALTLRFDIFWSRIPLILDSSEGEDVRRIPAILANAQHIGAELPLLDQALADLRPGDAASAKGFEQKLVPLGPLLEEMSRRLLVQDELRYQTGDLAREIWMTATTLLVAVIAGAALVVGNVTKLRHIRNLFEQYKETEQVRAGQLAVIESSGDGVVMFDTRGRLEYSNEAFHRLIGDDFTATLTRKHWSEFLSPGSIDLLREMLRNRRPTESWQGEVVGRTLREEERSWEIHILMRQEGGFTALVRDLSDRKTAALQREALLERLHHVDKMEAVGRLAGGIAHDFNNILAAISGFGSLLEQDLAQQPAQLKMVRRLLSAANRGKELVQGIMTFSRADRVERTILDAGAICREAAAMIMSTVTGKARFKVDIAAAEMLIYGNATQINRAVINLCINARDALGDRGGLVSLVVAPVLIDGGRMQGMREAPRITSIEAPIVVESLSDGRTKMLVGVLRHAPGAHLRIRVSDTGSGIDEAIMRRMFDPFFTTKGVGEGTGLGLSSVLGIVTAHNGALAIESAIGRGTTFDILLPLQMAATLAKVPKAEPAPVTVQAAQELRVLIVDDDGESGNALAAILEKIGCDPAVCESAEEALAVLRDEPNMFDLVVTDYLMPGMNGLQLAEALRGGGMTKPIILTTGNLEDVTAAERTRFGIELVIAKPFTLSEVTATIHSLIGTAKPPSALDGTRSTPGQPIPAQPTPGQPAD